ncbi:uncharacterized protein AMSG_03068 [Thecamonas trahens ATCC 50062]|uniref:Uncharacterized protein n=1 Tax=Thecamonas trahens ATCC 50062 TaxID=461836 RepID=A0A0L0D379_THETB|nr:hypothetical protein AMSG_03068 [Thecamonas trahens ATCC 50062]KNC46631.1 hypothetical protein AMSG_03068 [Thecamonas trahens ATCC 50062]|eukprot:XP_013760404.1 hypothetical protein AMSG_03068 [Thecamonas trahens ATCC 50062]
MRDTAPPLPPPPLPPGNIKWIGNPVVGLLDYVLDSVVGASGPLGLNKIVDVLTAGTGMVYIDDLASFGLPDSATFPLGSAGNLTLTLHSLNVSGLNTWTKFDALVPTGAYTLTSQTATSKLMLVADVSVNVSIPASNATLRGAELYEAAQLEVSLADSIMDFGVLLGVLEKRVVALSPSQVEDPGCLLALLSVVNVTDISFNTTVESISLTPLTNANGVEGELDAALDAFVGMLLSSFNGAVPAFFDCFIATPLSETFNVWMAGVLADPPLLCSAPTSPAETFNYRRTFQAFLGALILSLLIVVLLVLVRNSMAAGSQVKGAHEESPLLSSSRAGTYAELAADAASPGSSFAALGGRLDEKSSSSAGFALASPRVGDWHSRRGCCAGRASLSVDDSVPWFARYAIPAVILVNIALFVSANTSVGASVEVVITLGTGKVMLPPIFSFTLANSVHDMWEAGVYPLALLIAVFSGAWPYLKLLMMLGAWLIPVSSDAGRERVLRILDACGKYSLIDSYVLVMMMVAFRMTMAAPAVPSADVPAGATAIDIVVVPYFGFYGFLIATIVSLCLTHVILHYHRAAAAVHQAADPNPDAVTGPVILPSARVALASSARATSAWLPGSVALLLVTSFGLVAAGAVVKSFELEFHGLTELVLAFLGEKTATSYSLISLGLALPSASTAPDSIGIRTIQLTFFMFAMIIPVIHHLVLGILWLAPLTEDQQERIFRLAEVLNAWSSLDVFVISVIAALLEIHQFAAFIVGDKCNAINPLLAQYFSSPLHNDNTCMDVRATLDHGCWILFVACLIYIFCSSVIAQSCHSALARRRASHRSPHRSPPILALN